MSCSLPSVLSVANVHSVHFFTKPHNLQALAKKKRIRKEKKNLSRRILVLILCLTNQTTGLKLKDLKGGFDITLYLHTINKPSYTII